MVRLTWSRACLYGEMADTITATPLRVSKLATNPILFFFQAEDGIRDDLVTGVQTCGLPISSAIRLRICWASGAGESATDRSRHTGQRSPVAIACTRSAGVGAGAGPRAATAARAASATSSSTARPTAGRAQARAGRDAAAWSAMPIVTPRRAHPLAARTPREAGG